MMRMYYETIGGVSYGNVMIMFPKECHTNQIICGVCECGYHVILGVIH